MSDRWGAREAVWDSGGNVQALVLLCEEAECFVTAGALTGLLVRHLCRGAVGEVSREEEGDVSSDDMQDVCCRRISSREAGFCLNRDNKFG